ncbi:hypothetical protein Q0F99_11000 [Rathayibacter oskolensis]|uniref:hypothetical protein n=1 Tax=Rathayibacter oskolensis TaxID=1891671 RepID=UPI00265FF34B|nr:hypothetical protein [Rathayibacter oskolensis]WKK70409.1 hypothetical protein Q0F99_11000 [Rathayibacter oskolensis]
MPTSPATMPDAPTAEGRSLTLARPPEASRSETARATEVHAAATRASAARILER